MEHISFKKMLVTTFIVCALGLLAGLFGGLLGALFAHTLSFVTELRGEAKWLVFLLPLGGVATVLLYHSCGMDKYRGTNEIVLCLKNNTAIRAVVAPLIFICTAITHLFGGSAGREGAALQLGGAGAAAAGELIKLRDDKRQVLIMCGMTAVFAGVFGTPFTAAFFVLEFKSSRKLFSLAALPCLISAMVAKTVSSLLNVEEETVILKNNVRFSLSVAGKVLILALALSLLGIIMCFIFDKAEVLAKKFVSNPYIRTFIFSAVVVMLTYIVSDMRYNGSGMEMAMSAVHGNADWFDFILKIVFTGFTLAAGLKGGKIVPTFCIGATFGCTFGGLLGLDPGFAAALGLVGLFCHASNSLFGAVFLGIELFGFAALPYFIIICIILWLLSAEKGLFENRFFKSPIFTLVKNKI